MFANSEEEMILAERAGHLKKKSAEKNCIKVKAGVIVDVTEMESLCGLKRHYRQWGKI